MSILNGVRLCIDSRVFGYLADTPSAKMQLKEYTTFRARSLLFVQTRLCVQGPIQRALHEKYSNTLWRV